jgi:DNA-binding NarL/FixJ family response regulator
VVVVDDHHLFRVGVKAELQADCDVVGEASAPAEAIATIDATSPDVLLLDVHIPDGGGVAVLRALQGTADPPRVLALSVSDAAEDVVPMIRAGALGYVTKTIDAAELVAAIERVAAGDAYFSPRLAAFVLQEFSAPAQPSASDTSLESLTPREREVIAPPGARLLQQANRCTARHQPPHGRVARRRGAPQAAADLAPRGRALGRDQGADRSGRGRRAVTTATRRDDRDAPGSTATPRVRPRPPGSLSGIWRHVDNATFARSRARIAA